MAVVERTRTRTAPNYLGHLAEFNNEKNAAEFTAFISIMEGYSVANLLRDGRLVAFEATPRSAGSSNFGDWSDWSTVVRYFNTSGADVHLDGRRVGVATGSAA